MRSRQKSPLHKIRDLVIAAAGILLLYVVMVFTEQTAFTVPPDAAGTSETAASSAPPASTSPQISEEKASLEVHFIDVGQGDATLIKTDGHYMLIDAGDNSKGTAVQLYLQKQGVEKLDYLVLTHTDADHIGGADVIVSKFTIDHIFLGDFQKGNETYEELMDAIAYKNMTYSTPAVGAEYQLGNAVFTILAPNRTYEDSNNGSIALLLRNGDNTFLFTGDCEEEAEKDILANGTDIDCDVYKAGHHGSRDSSSQSFLEAAAPAYAVISCEAGNSYGHPHTATLNNLRAMDVQVFRTDEQGSVIAYSDGVEITWNCAPSEYWQAGEPGKNTQSSQAPQNVQEHQSDQSVQIVQDASGEKNTETAVSVENADEITYVCNKNSKKFHIPSCSSVADMKESNKLPVTWTREETIANGYTPCGSCKP